MTSKNNKILLILIVVLLLANSIFTVIMWFKHHQPPRPNCKKEKPEFKNHFFSEEIGFDSIQQITFDSLFDAHHKMINELKANERNAKIALFTLLKSDTATKATVEFYAKQASTITMQIDTLTYYHFKKIKSICKPEQMVKLEDFFENHFLHQKDNNPDKLDSSSSNKQDRKNFHRMPPPPNVGPERFRPEGMLPPPPRNEMNEDGPPPPPPPGKRMGHRPPPFEGHDGPPPPDRRPPGE